MPNLLNQPLAVFVMASALCFSQSFEKRVSPVAAGETRSFQKQTKVALLVGVSQYPSGSGLSPLNYAANDAEELGAALKAQGYLVNVLTNGEATRGSILRTLQELRTAVDPDQGTFLFYFSGHGFAVGGKNYLAPISASQSDLAREGLPVEEVEQALIQSKAKRQIMLLDACRNDPSAGEKGSATRSFANLEASEGLRILNSTRLGSVSYESADLKHGVFTAYVLKALGGDAAGTDGLVTFHDLSDYVASSVRRWGVEHGKVQIPFEAVGISREASGDFLLAKAATDGLRGAPAAPSPRIIAADARKLGETKLNPKDGLTYVWIPPGSFMMGCSPRDDSGCDEATAVLNMAKHMAVERPQHRVSITKGFWLGQTSVTQSAYQRIMRANPSFFNGSNLPVEQVTWDEANDYCSTVGGRLPTEAEWEYAARAGTAGARYGDLDSIAWYRENSGKQTHPVGTKRPNAWGLYDMLGNVWQWTADWFDPQYYSQQNDTDPRGPRSGNTRVARGGSWDVGPWNTRVAFRGGDSPAGSRMPNHGFRCAEDLL